MGSTSFKRVRIKTDSNSPTKRVLARNCYHSVRRVLNGLVRRTTGPFETPTWPFEVPYPKIATSPNLTFVIKMKIFFGLLALGVLSPSVTATWGPECGHFASYKAVCSVQVESLAKNFKEIESYRYAESFSSMSQQLQQRESSYNQDVRAGSASVSGRYMKLFSASASASYSQSETNAMASESYKSISMAASKKDIEHYRATKELFYHANVPFQVYIEVQSTYTLDGQAFNVNRKSWMTSLQNQPTFEDKRNYIKAYCPGQLAKVVPDAFVTNFLRKEDYHWVINTGQMDLCLLKNEYLRGECYLSGSTDTYYGMTSSTQSGKQCQRWDSDVVHTRNMGSIPPSYDRNHNYCRNPSNDGTSKPWCYTTDPNTRWEYCSVPTCGKPRCYFAGSTGMYYDKIATTVSGHQCQRWDDDKYHSANSDCLPHPDDRNHNHCRATCGNERPWCYTTNKDVRWEYCDVPRC